jgi:hypothetical protein
MGNDNSERRETINDPLANYVLSPEHRAEPPKISTYFNTDANVRKETDAQLQAARLALARAQYDVVDRADAERVAVRRSASVVDPGVWPPPVYDQVPDDVPLDPLYAIAPYESPRPVAYAAIAALATDIAAQGLTLCAGPPLASIFGDRVVVTMLICVAVFAVVLFQTWMYRVYKNLRAFHVGGLSTTPAKAVASWFIPILTYYRPWQILSEVWRASDPAHRIDPLRPQSWKDAPSSTMLLFWGLTYVAAHLLSYALGNQAGHIDWRYDLAFTTVHIVFACLTIGMVHRISSRQDEKIARLYA